MAVWYSYPYWFIPAYRASDSVTMRLFMCLVLHPLIYEGGASALRATMTTSRKAKHDPFIDSFFLFFYVSAPALPHAQHNQH